MFVCAYALNTAKRVFLYMYPYVTFCPSIRGFPYCIVLYGTVLVTILIDPIVPYGTVRYVMIRYGTARYKN